LSPAGVKPKFLTVPFINDSIRVEAQEKIMERNPLVPSLDVYKTLSGPLDAQIELTSRCNNYCVHCYNYWRGDKFRDLNKDYSNSSLSLTGLETTIRYLAQHQIIALTFTGGEPLLKSRKLLEGIKLAKQYDIACSINSNLTLITPELARELKISGVDSILASLHASNSTLHDTITQRKGSFKQTVRGIDICVGEGLDITANMVVSALNKDQVLDTGRLVKSKGVSSFSATKVSPCMGGINFDEIDLNKEDYKKMLDDLLFLEAEEGMHVDSLISYPLCALGNWGYYRKFIERKCAAGVATCAISAEGNVRPCTVADEVYGNIFNETLEDIWKRMTDWRDGSRIPKGCLSECEYFPSCRAGCRMNAKYCNGIDGMDPLATSPEGVYNQPQNQSETFSPMDLLDRKLVLGKKIKFRSEDFGGIVSNGPRASLFLDKLGYIALKEVRFWERPFTIKEIQDQFSLTEAPNEFFFRLFKLGFIQPVNETIND